MINIHLLCLILLIQPSYSSYYYDETKSEWLYIQTPVSSIFLGPQDVNITANITFKSYESTCGDEQLDVFNRIAILKIESQFSLLCSKASFAEKLQIEGGVGVISIPEVSYGGLSIFQRESSSIDINIPIASFLHKEDVDPILKLIEGGFIVPFQFIFTPNPFFEALIISRYFWWFFIAPWSFVNIILSSIGIMKLHKCNEKNVMLSYHCLIVEALSNLIRFVYVIIDPAFSVGVLSVPLGWIMLQFTEPLLMCMTLVIAFYWKRIYENCKTMRKGDIYIPLYVYILMGLVIVSFYTSEILKSLYAPAFIAIIITVLLILIIDTSIGIFFIYSGFNMLSMLKTHIKDLSKQNQMQSIGWTAFVLTKITYWVFISSGFLLLHVVTAIIAIFPFAFTPEGWPTVWIMIYVSISGISSTHIMAFYNSGRNKWTSSGSED